MSAWRVTAYTNKKNNARTRGKAEEKVCDNATFVHDLPFVFRKTTKKRFYDGCTRFHETWIGNPFQVRVSNAQNERITVTSESPFGKKTSDTMH